MTTITINPAAAQQTLDQKVHQHATQLKQVAQAVGTFIVNGIPAVPAQQGPNGITIPEVPAVSPEEYQAAVTRVCGADGLAAIKTSLGIE